MYLRPPPAAHLLAMVALTVALLGGALTWAGAAWAHAVRIGSDPAEGAVLADHPLRVSATFNEPMQAQFAAMTVIGPDGNMWSDGEPGVDGAVISVAVRPGGPTGDYTVNYRATSADGHVVSGSWSYRVVPTVISTDTPTDTSTTTGEAPPPHASPTAESAPPAPDASRDGMPVWPFVAAASALVAAGAIVAVRRQQ